MVDISIKHNVADTLRIFDDMSRNQVPFATKNTLNILAETAKRHVISEEKKAFDRPTPFTLNSTYIRYATKQNLSARIFVKDIGLAKSKSLAESIGQEFSGGTRIRKRLELWLERAGYISSNEYVVPGEGAQLDQYGNMSRGQIQKILSQLSAGADAASFRSGSARSKASRAVSGYFWSRGGKLKRGVWGRFNFGSGNAVKPILIVVSSVHYKQRVDMDEIGRLIVNRDFTSEFKRQFDAALSTAR